MQGDLKGAHTVPAKKGVIAIPWQPVGQPLQQSGTLLGMRIRLRMSLSKVTKWFGGGMTGVVAGSSALLNAQLLARTLVDGTLARAPHTLISHVPILT